MPKKKNDTKEKLAIIRNIKKIIADNGSVTCNEIGCESPLYSRKGKDEYAMVEAFNAENVSVQKYVHENATDFFYENYEELGRAKLRYILQCLKKYNWDEFKNGGGINPKEKIIAYYNALHYTINVVDGEEIYEAGNSPHDSGAFVSAEDGVGLAKMKKYAIQTGKEMAEERGAEFVGAQVEEQGDDEFKNGGRVGVPTNAETFANGEIIDDYPSDVGGSNNSIDNIVEFNGKTYIIVTDVELNVLSPNEKASLKEDYEEMARGGTFRTAKAYEQDHKLKALHPGKRISESGNAYYENRPNRSDKNRTTRFTTGGFIEKEGMIGGGENPFENNETDNFVLSLIKPNDITEGWSSSFVGHGGLDKKLFQYSDGKFTVSIRVYSSPRTKSGKIISIDLEPTFKKGSPSFYIDTYGVTNEERANEVAIEMMQKINDGGYDKRLNWYKDMMLTERPYLYTAEQFQWRDGGDMQGDNYARGGTFRTAKAYIQDHNLKAIHPGKRISESGNVYYENRPNRSDKNRTTRFATGGAVENKKYILHSYSGDCVEDNYKEGESNETYHSFQVNVGETYNSKQELIDAMNNIMDTTYEENHFDWETGEGKNVQTDLLVSFDASGNFSPATEKEKNLWKLDKKTLYNCHYWFYATPMFEAEEYARGGTFRTAKAYEQDHKLKALHPGKRISESGNVYYENRPNRSDKNRTTRFATGGDVSDSYYQTTYYDKQGGHGALESRKHFTNSYNDALALLKREKRERMLGTSTGYIGVEGGGKNLQFAILFIDKEYINTMNEKYFKNKQAYKDWLTVAQKCLKTGKPQKGKFSEK